MASKSASGLTKEEREKFLRESGFVPARSGKGSHEQWEHVKLKELSRSHKIEAPGNVLSNAAQKPWEQTLCGDPGRGTWRSIEKHARWCQEKVEEIQNKKENEHKRRGIKAEFNKACKDMRAWKKSIRHHFKAALSREKAPLPPMNHDDFSALKEKKNHLSIPKP